MALKELEARYATKQAKEYKLADGEELYLLVRASGSKLWRFKYRLPANKDYEGGASLMNKKSKLAARVARRP